MKRMLSGLTIGCVVSAAFGFGGCGEHTHEVERYRLKDPSAAETKIGPFRLRAVISGEVSTPGLDNPADVLVDSHGQLTGPYTLHVVTSYYGQTQGVCKLHEVTMRIGDQPVVVLHAETDPVIDVAYQPWLPHAVSGSVVVPLGDRLPFQTRDDVVVTVKYQPPERPDIHDFRAVFVGDRSKTVTSKLDTLLRS